MSSVSKGEVVPAEPASVRAVRHDHIARFYDDDLELNERVVEYLLGALEAGGVAVMLATAPHRAVLEMGIASAGIDMALACRDGKIISLDAEETMGRLLVGYGPRPDLFSAVVGGHVRRAAASGGPVHVYGEMVDLLWRAGQVNAVVQLERLWVDLGQELPFSLFCAYHNEPLTGDDHAGVLSEIHRLHSVVLTGPPADEPSQAKPHAVSCHFPASLNSPRDARRFVVAALKASGDDALMADAALVVTELATNAVLHAHSGFTVAVSPLEDGARVSVLDGGTREWVDKPPALMASSGRGLGLVAAVAKRWGTTPVDNGRLVWADLTGRYKRETPQVRG
jgi:anti-sigma regulatory factor (Ser/Thr protein kinase)